MGTTVLKAYRSNLLYFAAVSLSWVGAYAGSAPVDPLVDDATPLRSVDYSALSLVAWLGLLVGGG